MSSPKCFAAVLLVVLFVGIGAAQDARGTTAKGKEIFDTSCGLCHLTHGNEKKIGPGLKGIKDGKLPSGKEARRANVMQRLNKGGGGMPAFERLLSSEEKEDVVAYIMTL